MGCLVKAFSLSPCLFFPRCCASSPLRFASDSFTRLPSESIRGAKRRRADVALRGDSLRGDEAVLSIGRRIRISSGGRRPDGDLQLARMASSSRASLGRTTSNQKSRRVGCQKKTRQKLSLFLSLFKLGDDLKLYSDSWDLSISEKGKDRNPFSEIHGF